MVLMAAPRAGIDGRRKTEASYGRLLGEHRAAKPVRLTLHDSGDGATLLRHRHNPHAGSAADIAAHVDHAGGVVSRISWDHWHTRHQPVWMASVEDWIAARIAADWAEQS